MRAGARILVDADACPVVDIVIRLAGAHGAPCVLLCDSAHMLEREGARTITYVKGADSVDFALVNMVQRGDIVVTQDYGLAAMCLARGARPVSQNGMRYTADNIDALLASRHMARKIRGAGGRLKGQGKRTRGQDEAFERALSTMLEEDDGE